MEPRRRTRLFHAIVGLGLVAASCGGKEQPQSADAGQNGPLDSQSPEASTELDAIAMADVTPDRGPDVGPDVAADVAADVAEEVWHPIVIQ